MHTALLLLVSCLILRTDTTSDKQIICHLGYREVTNFSVIDPLLCTHVIYCAVEYKDINVAVMYSEDGFRRLHALHQENPALKIMISMEVLGPALHLFPAMASNAASRRNFTRNVSSFIRYGGFDGFDIDWMSPNESGDKPEQVQDFIELLKVLRAEFNRQGLLLSASVEADEISSARSSNVSEMSKYLDFIHLKAFNFNEWFQSWTVTDAALQARYYDGARDKAMSVEASVMYWLSHGAPRDKLIVGVSSIGRLMTLENPNSKETDAPARSSTAIGGVSSYPGRLAYFEICELHKSKNWSVTFDEEHRVPYSSKKLQWISYDNVRSVREKAEFIARLNLGGAMLWDILGDDFGGTCGEKYPLLRTLGAVLRGGTPVSEEPLPPVTKSSPEIIHRCPKPGYMRDPQSCGLIMCVSNPAGDYDQYRIECYPGNCTNSLVGRIHARNIDYNFFVCG